MVPRTGSEGTYDATTGRSPSTATRQWRPVTRCTARLPAARSSGFDNCFVMRFDETGRCRDFTEWFMQRPT